MRGHYVIYVDVASIRRALVASRRRTVLRGVSLIDLAWQLSCRSAGMFMADYKPHEIEPRWQQHWDEHDCFRTGEDRSKPKYYVLDMFPYPSGAGLHVGHPEGYTATDIIARYKRMRGFNVLHPMGWDAFGLPAERAAMREGEHPATLTARYIANFKRQIKRLGFSYDWDREIDTTDPKYYKWSQWIFLKLYEQGLAYEAEIPVNWCPAQGTVLANEEVQDGKYVETGDPVVRLKMRQWQLRIPLYAERLLQDLETLDWPEPIKEMQRNWIGKSEGAEVDFALENGSGSIRVFTTRPDTLFGATYMVVAPEHSLVPSLMTNETRSAVEAYIQQAAFKSDMERTELAKTKTGVFSGAWAINPVNGQRVPVWIADYVLATYGTGAIMAVPGHDERDWEFAKTFDLPIVEVVSGGNVQGAAFTGDGPLVNSDFLNGLDTASAKKKITAWLEEKALGKGVINYRLRDWLFSRQRYWGEPFPVLHLQDGTVKPMDVKHLPVTLPHLDDFRPTSDGAPPLARATEWVSTVDPDTGLPAMRETNTMPQWAGSCWYYLRYIDPHNHESLIDAVKENYWMPVDLYVGGAEHAVLHLLYARFWHKVLYDCGVVSTVEPFQKLFNQGMILAFSYCTTDGKYFHRNDVEEENGEFYVWKYTNSRSGEFVYEKANRATETIDAWKAAGDDLTRERVTVNVQVEKMSKSKYNVANPDDVVEEFGADSLRLYEMYMGPLEATKPWQTESVKGMHRFLARAYRIMTNDDGGLAETVQDVSASPELERLTHLTIKRVTEYVEDMRFNTAIAAMIELLNELYRGTVVPLSVARRFTQLLAPFAPHLGEELWRVLGASESITYEPWPTFDPAVLVLNTLTIAVQVNGKMRGTVDVAADAVTADVVAAAKADPKIMPHLADKELVKEIYVPGKILNLIVKG